MKSSGSEVERVWLLVGVALAALFLLRTAGMVFAGAVTGFSMFVGLYVLFSWFPPVRRILFSMGGVFDIAVSFGLPYLVSMGMGITGGTMMIATITCGLLFTFSIATKKLGGTVRAITSSTSLIARSSLSSFEAWRKDLDGRRNQMDLRSNNCGNQHGSRNQRKEAEEAPTRSRRGEN